MTQRWTKGRVRKLAQRIDRLNQKVEEAVEELFYSDFPNADVCRGMVEELRGDCVVLASAEDIIDGYLREESE